MPQFGLVMGHLVIQMLEALVGLCLTIIEVMVGLHVLCFVLCPAIVEVMLKSPLVAPPRSLAIP